MKQKISANDSRERDPLLAAPFYPRPTWSRKAQASGAYEHECRQRLATNRALLTLQQLARGELNAKPLEVELFGLPKEWNSAPQSSKDLVEHLRRTLLDDGIPELPASLASRTSQFDSARRLLRGTKGPWSKVAGASAQRPARGQTWPMTLEDLDLPEEGTQPIPISQTSEVASFYIEAIEELMLDPGGYEAAELVDAYQDPLLDDRKNKLGLATRLWKSGMLMVTSHVNFVVSFFTVVKKVIELEDGFRVMLRLIFDYRKGNCLWRRPPFTPLSGPGVLGNMDLSHESLNDLTFEAASGDVPSWFFVQEVPEKISQYFGFPEITATELTIELRRQGWKGPMPDASKGEALAVKTLLMGWSWAVFLAQMNLKDILKPALDEGRLMIQSTQALIFKAPTETSAFWLYVDDFGVLILTNLPGSARAI